MARPRPSDPMTPDQFAAALEQADPGAEIHVSRETSDRLQIYAAQLKKWNPAINLVAPGTLPDLWRRHFLDSAQLLPLAHRQGLRRGRWLDLGSGGGFPGLVLAALGWPDLHLVESDQRKAVFLRETARLMGVAVTVHACRIEQLEPAAVAPAAVISARALAPLADLLRLAQPFAAPDTLFLLPKGRQAEDELTLARESMTMASVTLTPSLTDPDARILQMRGIGRL